MRSIIAIVIAVFALSGCVALPITFGVAQVGMGFSNGDPSVAPDTECVDLVVVGCEAEHDTQERTRRSKDEPVAVPGPTPTPVDPVPDVPDEPDNDQCDDGDTGSDRDDKPGWGSGDKNHDHSGPPGLDK